ncbi:aldolase [Rhodoferax sp.]|uniref:aldolase n=2 Tax=Rhodoferax sp. TaxID=50421 RepID=UPI0027481998|nr:aldolase [Rhodoferax sp.]MDP2443421.1 aldolase [Rhodoferax sp.]MDZ4207106.1 aldolase [Rhodoferax sp.]
MDSRLMEDRKDLAAVFRGAAMFSGQAGVCSHFSLRVSDDPLRFLLNPWGMYFSEARASELMLVDENGVDQVAGRDGGFAAFNIHAQVHAIHPEARCVLHTHMPYATAITMLDKGRLEPASQEALRFYDDIAYDDSYNGLAHDPREGERIARRMGNKHVLFLAHHGVIVVGPSVAQAFDHLYYLERAAQLQVLAMSCNRPLRMVPDDIAHKTVSQFGREREHWARLHLDALRRKLDCEHPEYAS